MCSELVEKSLNVYEVANDIKFSFKEKGDFFLIEKTW